MQADNKATDSNGKSRITELFFALIRCGIGKSNELPCTPDKEEWEELFSIATKQTLAGIAFAGIERLPQEQRPPKRLLIAWHRVCGKINGNNATLDSRSVAVSRNFERLGFRNCILKGQGIAQLYPEPAMRTSGDVDIWLEGGADKILQYVRRCFPNCKPTYHHVDFPVKEGLSIEIHFTPSWMYSPFRNRRLQKFIADKAGNQFTNTVETTAGTIPVPTLEFNRIYILLHIYRHLFQEGIGLRQMLDYYFVLDKGFTAEERNRTVETLRSIGLLDFAAAAMYVLKERFGLEEEKLLTLPDARRGEFLLKEIMTAGNFGKYDSRYAIVPKEKEFSHFLNSMRRTIRLITQYPGETLWSPYFKIWHMIWRRRNSPNDKK